MHSSCRSWALAALLGVGLLSGCGHGGAGSDAPFDSATLAPIETPANLPQTEVISLATDGSFQFARPTEGGQQRFRVLEKPTEAAGKLRSEAFQIVLASLVDDQYHDEAGSRLGHGR